MPRQAELIRLHVAAGILVDARQRVLIAERVDGGTFQGLWEFPGGKIAAGETPEAALIRELDEEIGVRAAAMRHFAKVEHRYADREVRIEFFVITGWRNEPESREGQQLKWVTVEDLSADEMLPANRGIVAALKRENESS